MHHYSTRESEDQVRLRSSVAHVPCYTQEGRFLRGSLDLAPVSSQAPNWKRPSCTQKTTATSSPAGCPGKRQPRDTIDGGSKVVYANQDRGRKTRPNFSIEENLPQHTQDFMCPAKLTQREERRIIGPPRHALCQPKQERENPAKFFRVEEKLFPAHTRFHMSCKTNVTR